MEVVRFNYAVHDIADLTQELVEEVRTTTSLN